MSRRPRRSRRGELVVLGVQEFTWPPVATVTVPVGMPMVCHGG